MAAGFRQRSLRGVGRAEREEMEGEAKPCRVMRKTELAVAKERADAALVRTYEDPRRVHVERAKPGALRDFHILIDKERLRKRLGDRSGQKIRAREDDHGWRSILDSKNPAAEAEERMERMLLWLEQGKPLHAVEGLNAVAEAYLNDGSGAVPREVGEEALRCIEVIGRAWAVAAASEYLELPLKDYMPYFKGGKVFDGEGEISWPYWAIKLLGATGKLSDLAIIRIAAQSVGETSTERRSTLSSNFIIITAALRLGLRNLDAARRQELGIADLKSTEEQLVHALKYLFNELGIARALSMLPSIRKCGPVVHTEYIDSAGRSHDSERDAFLKLAHEGLSQRIRMFDISSSECLDIMHSRGFLLRHGIISNVAGTHEYVLSEKGEMLVRAIIAEVMKGEMGVQEVAEGATLLLGE